MYGKTEGKLFSTLEIMNTEIIDNFLSGTLPEAERKALEARMKTDTAFAKEVAVQLMAHKAAKQAADEARKADFDELRGQMSRQPKQPMVTIGRIAWAAAASLALIVGFFWLSNRPANELQLTENYISHELAQLPQLMGAEADSMQNAIALYNQKDYEKAKQIFEKIQSNKAKATEYAGLCALQSGDYKTALELFGQLEKEANMASRARLLQAMALIKSGDKSRYFEVLKSINIKDLSLEEREYVQSLGVLQ